MPKPWTGKTAATHIQSIISGMTQEEKDNLEKEAEAQGLGFKKESYLDVNISLYRYLFD